MANDIYVDSGIKTFNIRDKNNKDKLLGQFSFNPSDTNIIKRYNDFAKRLETLQLPEKDETFIEEFDKIIYPEVNKLLNSDDAAESLFSVMGPLSPANSDFYLYEALNAIRQAIEIETGKRMKKIEGKIKKHTLKYHG